MIDATVGVADEGEKRVRVEVCTPFATPRRSASPKLNVPRANHSKIDEAPEELF
jgi:hypothetical protein